MRQRVTLAVGVLVLVAGGGLAFFFAGGPAAPASAQDTGWVIESIDVSLDVRADGSLRVREVIDVDFRDLRRHGIYRVIPVRYEIEAGDEVELPPGGSASDYWRELRISDVRVDSTAPDDLDVTWPSRFEGRDLTLRVGDPDRTVSGRHRYDLRYDVRGALNAFPTHAELYWNATGVWPVPVQRATVTVTMPQLEAAACFRGVAGSTGICERLEHDGSVAEATTGGLRPGEQVTVVAGAAPGAVAVEPPLLVERWSLGRGLAGSPAAWPLAGLLALVVLVGLARLLWREGRDRVAHAGASVDGMIEGDAPRRPLFKPRAAPVRFRPPDGLRPAHLGLIVDERVDPVEISATIVDLAVRGHLVIAEESHKRLWSTRTDWTLRRREAEDDDVLPFERALLDALFEDGDEVSVAELKGEFAEAYKRVEKALYADAVSRGWFNRSPETTRSLWLGAGLAVLIAGLGLLAALTAFTRFGVVALPVAAAGLVLVVAHGRMPHRTATGSRALKEALGFREFIRTAEAGRMDFAEQENLFLPYLPFAVVFGAVDKWAGAFSALGTEAAEQLGSWYVGSSFDGGPNLAGLSAGLSDFASSAGGSLASTPASSGSSGFSGGSSGGGGGGGGGGSW